MIFLIAIAALLALPAATEETVFDAIARAEREAKNPLPPLTDEEWQRYIESMSETADADALRLDEAGELKAIFSDYFACYLQELGGQPLSNLSDRSASSPAYRSAFDACAQLRSKAQEEAERFAAGRPNFGDVERRKRAVNFYRQWQGNKLLDEYLETRGLPIDR